MIDTQAQDNPQKVYDFVYAGSGERLDVYLTRVQGYTRNFFHRLLGRGDIKVCPAERVGERVFFDNGEETDIDEGYEAGEKSDVYEDFDAPCWETKKKSYQLKSGDRIHIVHPERYLEASVLAQAPDVPEVEIVLEKPDYIVVHKPAGVLSHPNSVWGIEYPSVVGALYKRYESMPTVGNFIRAGLVHRLDRETDGLMIIAKTERGLAHFQKLFHDKSKAPTIEAKKQIPLHKRYRATSYILPEGQKILDSLGVGGEGGDRSGGYKEAENVKGDEALHANKLPYIISMVVEPKIPFYEPKLGITEILSAKINDISSCEKRQQKTRDATLEAAKKRHATPVEELHKYKTATLEVQLYTGRTHQIRYHLSQHGLPIVGDYLYGGDDFYQMQLQAFKLEFQDPDGEMQMVEI